jgi:predicted dehydrogenase
MYRHHPQTHRLREVVQDGTIGEPRLVRLSFHFRVEDPANDIRYSPTLAGGALRDVGCYCVSLANYLAGDSPSDAFGIAKMAASGVEERFTGLLLYPDGFVAEFDCGIDTELDVGVTVLGSRATARVPNPWYPDIPGPWLPGEPPMSIRVSGGGTEREISTKARNAYLEEIDGFARAVAGDRSSIVPPEETIRTLETIERLLDGARRI